MERPNQLIFELECELHVLNVKLGKLNHALSNPDEFEISEQQLGLMAAQANAMQKYSNILGERIDNLKIIVDK